MAFLVTPTSSTVLRPYSSTHSSQTKLPNSAKTEYESSRDEESPKVSGIRKAAKHINTPWQDKGTCVVYMSLSAMMGLWTLYTPCTFHGSSPQPWLLALGEMNNKFPLKAQNTGALNSRENFMLVKVGKKNLPKPCNEHSTHLTLASPFTPTQDLLVYSNTKWEVASMWLEYQFSWTSQYFKILHIKILTYIWWSWFKDNSKPWNWGLWIQGRFSCWQIRLFRVCCQPLLVLWRAGFLIHSNCFNSFEG